MLLEWHTLDAVFNGYSMWDCLMPSVPVIPLAIITVYTWICILNSENESYWFSPFFNPQLTCWTLKMISIRFSMGPLLRRKLVFLNKKADRACSCGLSVCFQGRRQTLDFSFMKLYEYPNIIELVLESEPAVFVGSTKWSQFMILHIFLNHRVICWVCWSKFQRNSLKVMGRDKWNFPNMNALA